MKKYFLVVDTETTRQNRVVDFGAVIVDKAGSVHASCGVLVREVWNDDGDELFSLRDADGVFSDARIPERRANYRAMIADGRRMVASVPAINRWLAKACAQYRPILTAYNLAFDLDKCARTGIDLEPFESRFCLWAAACAWISARPRRQRRYLRHVLDSHAFNAPTPHGNMTWHRKADTVSRFIAPDLPPEPHTALEDARDYEARVILPRIVKDMKRDEYMEAPAPDWRDALVRDWFQPK
jgi:hypothetical protein